VRCLAVYAPARPMEQPSQTSTSYSSAAPQQPQQAAPPAPLVSAPDCAAPPHPCRPPRPGSLVGRPAPLPGSHKRPHPPPWRSLGAQGYELLQGNLVRFSPDAINKGAPTAVLVHGILGSRKNLHSFARKIVAGFPSWQVGSERVAGCSSWVPGGAAGGRLRGSQ